MPDLPPVTVVTPAAAATITTQTIRRRPFAVLALNIVNGLATTLLAVLGYLQTINLAGIVTPEKALMWMVGVNVLTIILRQFASPAVVETTVQPVEHQP